MWESDCTLVMGAGSSSFGGGGGGANGSGGGGSVLEGTEWLRQVVKSNQVINKSTFTIIGLIMLRMYCVSEEPGG